jgi:hydroxylamine reductase
LTEQARQYGVLERKAVLGDDYVGLQELIVYGLKGMSAYEDHCLNLTNFEDKDPAITKFLYECFAFLNRTDASIDELLGMALKVGEINLRVMGNLEDLHTSKFGNPEPTKVRASGRKG